MFYIAIAVMFPNVVLLAMVLAGIILFHLQIVQEERYARQIFGESYAEKMDSDNHIIDLHLFEFAEAGSLRFEGEIYPADILVTLPDFRATCFKRV